MTYEDQRRKLLREKLPELWGPGTLLYVGASKRRAQFLDELVAAPFATLRTGEYAAGREVTVLEPFLPNVIHFRQRAELEVVQGDVRFVEKSLPGRKFDVAFWWHGPEHVRSPELAPTLFGLERKAGLVVLGAPWGEYPQGELEGNRWEQHLSAIQPEMFEELGYEVATLGKAGGRRWSLVLAWRRVPLST